MRTHLGGPYVQQASSVASMMDGRNISAIQPKECPITIIFFIFLYKLYDYSIIIVFF